MGGHEFFVVTFPTAGTTWAYDAQTQEWHQRSGVFSGGTPTRELLSALVYTENNGGTFIGGDYTATGKLFQLSDTTFTFDSVNMNRRLTGPLFSAEDERRLRISETQIDVEEGVITTAEVNKERQITLSWSKDGGHTYSSGVQLDLGGTFDEFILLEDGGKILLEADDGSRIVSEIGGVVYLNRVIQRKLGYGRLWNFRIDVLTPRKIIIKGAFAKVFGEEVSV